MAWKTLSSGDLVLALAFKGGHSSQISLYLKKKKRKEKNTLYFYLPTRHGISFLGKFTQTLHRWPALWVMDDFTDHKLCSVAVHSSGDIVHRRQPEGRAPTFLPWSQPLRFPKHRGSRFAPAHWLPFTWAKGTENDDHRLWGEKK